VRILLPVCTYLYFIIKFIEKGGVFMCHKHHCCHEHKCCNNGIGGIGGIGGGGGGLLLVLLLLFCCCNRR